MLLLVSALAAAVPAPPTTLVEVDVPADRGPQQVVVQRREFPTGSSSGWHSHPGIEIVTIVSGTTVLRLGKAPPRLLRAGESATIPRGVPHEAHASGGEGARLLITLVVDKGAPLRTAVPTPES